MPQDSFLNLDKRITVVETKFENVEQKVNKIDTSVDRIENHIARQNGTIPHIKENIDSLRNDVRTLITSHNRHEIAQIKNQTKTKLIWAVVSSVGTGLILFLVKTLIGM